MNERATRSRPRDDRKGTAVTDLNEQHELDVLARTAAADVYGGEAIADRAFAFEEADFEWGLSFNGGESRITCWLIDDTPIYVLSVVDGEADPLHYVEVVPD